MKKKKEVKVYSTDQLRDAMLFGMIYVVGKHKLPDVSMKEIREQFEELLVWGVEKLEKKP
jgi:hypothetical protein